MRLALFTGIVFSATLAQAATVSFRHGVNGYTGGRDTFLQSGIPDQVNGPAVAVSIDASDAGGVNHALMGFDNIVGPGAIPSGAAVTNASLFLTIDSVGSGMTMYRMVGNWNEATATWNTEVNGIQADDVEARSIASLSVGANNSNANVSGANITLDVTSDVQAWANGTTNNGWAMLPFVPNGTNGLDFFTKEESFDLSARPLLTVEYSIPEPTSLATLALAGIAIRRRR